MLGLSLSLSNIAVRGRGTPAPPATNDMMYADGDSITAPPGPTWFTIYAANNSGLPSTNAATAGSTLLNLLSRRQTVLDADPRYFVMLIGANDLDDTNNYPTLQSYVDAVFSYLAPIKAGGAKIAVGTTLERDGRPLINSRRAGFSAALKAAIGNQIDAVMDFDRTSVGAVGASANATLLPDGTHPSANPGQIILSGPATGAINFLRGIVNQPFQFSFTDSSGVAASTVSTSNKIRVTGLNYGESKQAAVSGGEMRVTPFGGAAGSWATSPVAVYEGDDVEVRGTSNATANGTTNVTLTVGTTTDTYTITTANNLAPLTTTFRSANQASPADFGSSYTFSGVQRYAGKAYVIIYLKQGSAASATVTLGGVTGLLKDSATKLFVFEFAGLAAGTGNLAITGITGGNTDIGYAMWSTDANAAFVEAKRVVNYGSTSPAETAPITLPAGGSILGGAFVETSNDLVPSSGIIERNDALQNGLKFWAVDRSTTGPISIADGAAYSGGHITGFSIQPA